MSVSLKSVLKGTVDYSANVANIWDGSGFYAPLKSSALLEIGTGSPTFTRATTAYVTGYAPGANLADGQVAILCDAGEARFSGARRISANNYSTVFADGTPIPDATLKGYLAEPAATNLCLQSNAFTTTWTAAGAPTVTQNAVGITGAANESWTISDTSAALGYITQALTLSTAVSYNISLFIKKTVGAQGSYPIFAIYTTASKIALCTIDTSNGISTTWTAYTGFSMLSGASSVCVNHNTGYWRVALSFISDTVPGNSLLFEPAGTTNATQSTGLPNAAAQGSAVIQGVQVELGSVATSYIPTTTVAVTRNADVESYLTASNIVAAQGSIYLEYTPNHAPVGTVALWGTYVAATNYTAILHDATNLIFRKRIASVNYDAVIANAFVAGTTYKMACTWGAVGSTIALNGTIGTPHANTTAAQIAATMQYGADGNSLQQPTAQIRNDRIWQTQLTDSTLAALTL